MKRSVWAMSLGMTAVLAGALCATARAETGDASEAAATLRAKVSPIRAIELVQNKTHGHVYGMGMEVSRGKSWYEVQVDVNGKPMVARIDPAKGRWLGMSSARGEDAEGMNTLRGSKVSLVQAIRSAETVGHGRAMEAGPYGAGASAHYDVDIAKKGGAISHFSVDANSGRVTAAPSDESD